MIKIEHLTKSYGDLVAVKDVSFTVQPGEVLGFLGPNGAGKSTTMRMIAGFLSPTEGRISVCRHDVENDPLAARRIIGYLPEGAPAYAEMTPAAFLRFIGELRGMDPDLLEQRLATVVAQLGLGKVLEQPIETLSKGFKRRVGLAQAILHDPQVLILDEPTDGLDPNQKHEVRALIQGMASDKIIVISTHILEEVHALCNRAIVISGGTVVADDTPEALEARSRYHQAVSLVSAQAEAIASALRALPEVSEVEVEGHSVTAFPKAGKALFGPISALLAERGWPVQELQLERGRLDEVFRTITQQGGRS